MAQKKKADLDMDEDFPTLFDELKHGFATAFAEIKVVMLQMLERSPFSCYLERSDEAKSNGEFLSQMLWQEVKLVSVWPDDGYCEIEVYNKEGILVGTLDSVKPERMIDGDKLRYGSDEWLTALGCILPFVKAYVRAAVGTPTPNRDRREQFDPNGECDYKIYVEPLPFDISEVLDLSCATLKRVKKNRSLVSSLVVSEVQTVSDEESSVLKPREKVSPDQWIANASINELCDYLAKKVKLEKSPQIKVFFSQTQYLASIFLHKLCLYRKLFVR